MLTVKRVLDWFFNVILVLVAGFNLYMVYGAEKFSQKAVFGLTGLAFAIAAVIFIRFTILTQAANKVDKT